MMDEGNLSPIIPTCILYINSVLPPYLLRIKYFQRLLPRRRFSLEKEVYHKTYSNR